MRRFLRTLTLFGATASLALGMLAIPACDDDAGCKDDFDCDDALVCKVSSGSCEALVCRLDTDCDGGQTCNDNSCD